MIPLHSTPPYSTIEGVPPGLQQTVENHRTQSLSFSDLFGLGFVLIVTILTSRQLAIGLHKHYQLSRLAVSLQRRATLERQLHRKLSRPASRKSSSQSP